MSVLRRLLRLLRRAVGGEMREKETIGDQMLAVLKREGESGSMEIR